MRNILIVLICVALLAACAPLEEAPTETTPEEPEEDVTPEEPQEVPEQKPDEDSEETDATFSVKGTEGDLITLAPRAVDPDDDVISYAFSEPFDKNGEWQTQLGDEGTYFVTVSASDNKGGRTTETVKVAIGRANRPPTITCTPVLVNEGDMVDLHDYCTVSDEDDEEIIVTYSGWMTSWRYQTTFDDAGKHTVTISASDRKKKEVLHTVREEITVTVKDVNRPPVFSEDFPSKIIATENDVITLPGNLIDDPDRDEVTVTFSEPFSKNGVWRTNLGDAGTYDVDVVATDGQNTAKKTVSIEISLLNTAPTLKRIPDITVDEGQTVKLPISATDREGDELLISISGWMDAEEYKTTYEDAGDYTVKVSVSDGEFTTDQIVHVTVQDVNRPPVFVVPG